jgi:hypothetical protein
MEHRYAITFRALGGDYRNIYTATAKGALAKAKSLVGVEVICITKIVGGRDLPITANPDVAAIERYIDLLTDKSAGRL